MFADQEILVYGQHRRSYGELLSRVRRLAASMRQAGVGRGEVVAALQTNSDAYVETYYAAATAGAVFVPLNYRAKPPELEYAIATRENEDDLRRRSLRGRLLAARARSSHRSPNVVAYETARPGWLRYDELLAEL